MNVALAAATTKQALLKRAKRKITPKREPDRANSLNHILWMLEGVTQEYVQHEKAHRWLGWAQACMYTEFGSLGLEELKNINKDS